MRTLDERSGDDGAVLQHILEVHEVAVVHMLGIIVRVVEVDDALLMRLNDLLRQEDAVRQVAADLARHVVALRGVDDGASSLLHSMRVRILSSVVLLLRTSERV